MDAIVEKTRESRAKTVDEGCKEGGKLRQRVAAQITIRVGEFWNRIDACNCLQHHLERFSLGRTPDSLTDAMALRDFIVNIAEGAEHTLTAWRARLAAPLMFLFGKHP